MKRIAANLFTETLYQHEKGAHATMTFDGKGASLDTNVVLKAFKHDYSVEEGKYIFDANFDTGNVSIFKTPVDEGDSMEDFFNNLDAAKPDYVMRGFATDNNYNIVLTAIGFHAETLTQEDILGAIKQVMENSD